MLLTLMNRKCDIVCISGTPHLIDRCPQSSVENCVKRVIVVEINRINKVQTSKKKKVDK